MNAYQKISVPVQIILGPEDTIVCNETSKRVYEAMKRDGEVMTEMNELPGLDHGPFSNAQSIDVVIDLLRGWFEAHSGEKAIQKQEVKLRKRCLESF